MRMDALAYENYNGPGVEIHCLFGTNVDTVEKYDLNMCFIIVYLGLLWNVCILVEIMFVCFFQT